MLERGPAGRAVTTGASSARRAHVHPMTLLPSSRSLPQLDIKTSRRPRWFRPDLAAAAIGFFGLAVAIGRWPLPGFAAGIVVAAAIGTVAHPVLLPIVAVPCAFVLSRIGPAAIDMSVSDATIAMAGLVAAGLSPWKHRRLAVVTGLVMLYLILLGITVASTPSSTAIFEWLHRGSMVIGAVFVGAAVTHFGLRQTALRLMLASGTILGVLAIGTGIANGGGPAYPLGMHKNAAGPMLVFVITLVTVAEVEFGLSRRLIAPARVIMILGMAATQSRGSIITLAAVTLLWFVIPKPAEGITFRRPAPALIAGLFGMGVFAYTTLNEQVALDDRFSSVRSREIGNQIALAIWEQNRLFGAGLRYFRQRVGLAAYEPHNVFTSGLAESGLVGIGALCLLYGGVLMLLWRMRTPLAMAAGLLLVAKVVESQFGIFWVAGTQTIPWLVVGLALGVRDGTEEPRDYSERTKDPLLSNLESVP